MNQYAPTRKVSTYAAATSLVTVGVWVAGLFGVQVPAEVAAAAATVVGFAAAWLIPERR